MRIENGTVTTITNIERYQRIIKQEKDKIDDIKTIIDSLTDSLVREVRNIFIPYSDKMMYEASCQQSKIKKDEKRMFLFMEEDLIENLFDENERKYVSLTSISCYGYEEYAYGFYFKYEKGFQNINFELKIPNVKKAHKDTIYYMNYGKYSFLYEKHSGCWNHIADSYDLDEIAAAIRSFLMSRKFFPKGE